ncbi:bis(5'-nucleosyl)-tetraphosphatase (symmetrical) YqeK [Caldicellulosiruptoraceae bacterium PP1]
MNDIQNYLIILENLLNKRRLQHSLQVMKISEELALHYNCDKQKAIIAGLLHDCAKCLETDVLLNYAKNSGIFIDKIMVSQKELLHGPAGKYVAEKIFLINDVDILNAIAYHTTGRENMSLLEKIIYVADIIEPSRCFSGIELIRELAFKDLDKSIIKAMESTLKYVFDLGGLVHPYTINARNQLILQNSLLSDRRDLTYENQD